MLYKVAMLAGAGALGTVARYGCSVLVARHAMGEFPWPTFLVNMIGCLLFGLIFALSEDRFAWSADTRLIVLTGFMGAFTTYSTFAYQSTVLLRESQWMLASANILGHNALGIIGMMLGIAMGKSL